jgi:hypothetical protein
MFQAYVSNVLNVFRLMFQVFHLDVAKVDLDVAYVVVAIHECLSMFQVFHLFS